LTFPIFLGPSPEGGLSNFWVRGPIESELNEYGHKGRVLAPVIGRYGGASSDLSLILDLVARELARKHTAFYNIFFSEATAMFKQKLALKWGHVIARGWATLRPLEGFHRGPLL